MGDDLPLTNAPRYRSLDLWRGIACLMIVIHHAGFLVDGRDLVSAPDRPLRSIALEIFKTMDLGVPFFFVISGYCIAASADLNRRRGRSSREFLFRRLRRIYPPYWAALLVFVAVTGGLDLFGRQRLHHADHALELASPGDLPTAQWLGNFTLTETWRPLVVGGPELIFTRVAWSLCYEEQFYFICFLLLLIAPKRLYAALAGFTFVFLAIRVVAWDTGWIVRFKGTFVMLWHEFAIGLAAYHRLNAAGTALVRRLDEAFIVAILAAALTVGYRETAAAALFGLALIPLRSLDERMSAWKWTAPLFACGRRCYSVYLVHLPVCVAASLLLYDWGLRSFWSRVFVAVPIVSIAATAFCFGFYELVEKRFLNSPLPVTSRCSEARPDRTAAL